MTLQASSSPLSDEVMQVWHEVSGFMVVRAVLGQPSCCPFCKLDMSNGPFFMLRNLEAVTNVVLQINSLNVKFKRFD